MTKLQRAVLERLSHGPAMEIELAAAFDVPVKEIQEAIDWLANKGYISNTPDGLE